MANGRGRFKRRGEGRVSAEVRREFAANSGNAVFDHLIQIFAWGLFPELCFLPS
jgi:hypothetical protein